ncbi:DUF4249 domain-containing protein [[Flexibacter] sp. ATCC 35103]|uniref:DUF4249 domain-containing protein n=1 Tax=[Flexibacter] sp. ATCC 35103 TaxID=1937528 RepID=UPI0009D2CED9|nr:DUF4249 domain-containing protein [[Flexibacter] sp. ATCC 35103]OMQ08401.1 hypothetical protein BXU01_20765 [[Flexibacter] sp. ATCC 35103]
MKKILLHRFLVTIMLASIFSCTTPYNYQTNGFEDAIVVEATITNEYKNQEIKLSRTYKLEEKTPNFESKAVVYVTDDIGNKYEFKESNESYISLTQFQAAANRTYQLHILTKDGRSYISSSEKLPQETQIDKLEAKAVTKNEQLGVEITVSSTDPTNNSRYYKYEYEETYKIVAPKWYYVKAVPVFFEPGSTPKGKVVFEERTEEARICFSNQQSNELILTNTNQLTEDKVTDFPVRFISSKDPIIKNRYSILVKQYVQTLAAHTFYETLKEISSTGSILSQTQPGFFYGNIQPVDNPGEKVIGFFNVSSYSEKRLFFNFADVFPGKPFPAYQYDCPAPIPELEIENYLYTYCFGQSPICQGNLILNLLATGTRSYFPDESGAYILYPIECGDCTSFSSNIKPSFWID